MADFLHGGPVITVVGMQPAGETHQSLRVGVPFSYSRVITLTDPAGGVTQYGPHEMAGDDGDLFLQCVLPIAGTWAIAADTGETGTFDVPSV